MQEFIPENGKMHVVGKSIRSTLFSVPDCQSIVKKAIVEAMKRKYLRGWFDESVRPTRSKLPCSRIT